MTNIDEPGLGDFDQNSEANAKPAFSIKKRILDLAHEQLFGVLCTQNNGQPYGSMIGFAFSPDLRYAVFATPRATRKYHNLKKCQNTAIVINNREKHPDELMQIEAFTATGKAEEISTDEDYSSWADLLVKKHSYLRNFLSSPSTALFKIKIIRYFHVSSFQQVHEWKPEDS
jgi:nitroimidazol reductase NimA-like FMN-containing flavoprotein (pyridoxamine 5'-phosphate oxidase superfamily)